MSEDDNDSFISRSAIGRTTSSSSDARSLCPKKKKKVCKKKRLTPTQAKDIHTSYMQNNKRRSIVTKKGTADFSTLISMDQENRDLLIESRNKKWMLDNQRHKDLKRIEEKKIRLEEQRLNMEQGTTRIKNETLKYRIILKEVKSCC